MPSALRQRLQFHTIRGHALLLFHLGLLNRCHFTSPPPPLAAPLGPLCFRPALCFFLLMLHAPGGSNLCTQNAATINTNTPKQFAASAVPLSSRTASNHSPYPPSVFAGSRIIMVDFNRWLRILAARPIGSRWGRHFALV